MEQWRTRNAVRAHRDLLGGDVTRLRLCVRPARGAAGSRTMWSMAVVSTNADPAGAGWTVNDRVLRLRFRGTERSVDLSGASRWTLGSDSTCSIVLDDASGRVSRQHAELVCDEGTWTVRDLGSTNGIRHNGDTRRSFQLAPGDEVELGGVGLIADSELVAQLHEMLRRFLGWTPEALPAVDRALRGVRDLAHMRAALFLCGQGSMEGLAKRIHAMTLVGRPFATLARGEKARAAMTRAHDGVLLMDSEHLPSDLLIALAGLRMPEARVRLIVAGSSVASFAEVAPLLSQVTTVWIPPLAGRAGEIERLLVSYGDDAAAQLGAPSRAFRPQDPAWLRASGIETLEVAEDAARRLVALRNWGVSGGAERLGLTHGALSRWASRRKIPT